MKNIFKTSFHFIFLIIPLLILGACAKDITSAGESTGGGGDTGGDGDFMPGDAFADLGENPPSTDLVGTWTMIRTIRSTNCPSSLMETISTFDLTVNSSGTCTTDSDTDDLESLECVTSASDVVIDTIWSASSTTCAFEYRIVDSSSVYGDSTLYLYGESKMEFTASSGCDAGYTYCTATAYLTGSPKEEGTGSSSTSGSDTGSETSGGTSGGSGSTGTDGGSGSGSDTGGTTEASTITVTSSQIVKDTLNATVEITNNTSVSSLIVKVLLQKSISITGSITSPGAFGTRNAVLGPKTLTIESGTTETKTLKFTIPENLSGTYTARIVLQYVDEEGVTQTLDTDLIRNLEIE